MCVVKYCGVTYLQPGQMEGQAGVPEPIGKVLSARLGVGNLVQESEGPNTSF